MKIEYLFPISLFIDMQFPVCTSNIINSSNIFTIGPKKKAVSKTQNRVSLICYESLKISESFFCFLQYYERSLTSIIFQINKLFVPLYEIMNLSLLLILFYGRRKNEISCHSCQFTQNSLFFDTLQSFSLFTQTPFCGHTSSFLMRNVFSNKKLMNFPPSPLTSLHLDLFLVASRCASQVQIVDIVHTLGAFSRQKK